MQETLRIHPVIIDVARVASDDDIMPLSTPIVGASGKVYNKLAIPRGTVVVVSPFGHNLWVIPGSNRSLFSLVWCGPAGTRRYGVLTPTSGVPNDGLRQLRILNHQLGFMGTCPSLPSDLFSATNIFPVQLFQEVLGLASDGDLRS